MARLRKLSAQAAGVLEDLRAHPAMVLAVLAVSAAITIYALSPGTGALTAIVVPGLTGLGAWAAWTRPRQAQHVNLAGRAAQLAGVALIVTCLVIALRVLVLYPVHAGGVARYVLWPGGAMVFAAELAAYLWPVLRRPGPLGATRYSGPLGVTAALVTASVLHLNQEPLGPSGSTVLKTAVLAPVAAGVLAVLLGAARRKPGRQLLRTGIGEWLWGVLLTGPATFIMLTTSTTAGLAVIIDARRTMLTYIMMSDPPIGPNVLDPIAQAKLADAVVMLTGVGAIVVLVFLLVFPPLRALRFTGRSLSRWWTGPDWVAEPELSPADGGWPERRPWWPGPGQPGYGPGEPGGGADIIGQGNPPS